MLKCLLLDLLIIGLFVFRYPELTFIGVIIAVVLDLLILATADGKREKMPEKKKKDIPYDDFIFWDDE